MKITINNFFESVKKAGVQDLPEVLLETYTLISEKTEGGKNWKEYKSDPGFKKLVDIACKKLEEYIQVNTEGMNGTKSKSLSLPELEKRMQTAKEEIKEYETFSKEQLIEVLEFTKERIKEEGHQPYLIIRKDALQKLINEMPENKPKNKFSGISREVYFIEWFLEFHDTIMPKNKLGIFIDELQEAMNKKEIRKTSPIAKDILAIQTAAVDQYNKMKSVEHFVLKPETVKKLKGYIVKHQNAKEETVSKKTETKKKVGLNGVPAEINTVPQEQQNKIISSTDFANMQFSTIGFKDKWLALMGDPAPGFTAMVFGMPKMGKSYLCVDFANYLSQNHGKVLYVTKEEYLSPTFQLKLKDKNTANANLDIAGELPNDLSAYQFIFLDSVSIMKLTSDQLKELEKNNPGKSFIYVFQVTKAGKARGTNEFMHNVDIVIEVPEKGKAVQFGRYNQGGELNIFPEASGSLPVQDNSAMLDGIKNKPMKNKNDNSDSWTEPERLNKKDHEDLKTINRLYKAGKYKEAMEYASYNCDTVIREEIPAEIWVAIGGELTKTGKEKLSANKIYSEVQGQIDRLTEVFKVIAKEKDATWGTVAHLANMHETFGTTLMDGYVQHHGYSKSVKEGMKRHTSACLSLLKSLSKKINDLHKNGREKELKDWYALLDYLLKSNTIVEAEAKAKQGHFKADSKALKTSEGEMDYSDEFRELKGLHEDNMGRKFRDEEFNEIFTIAMQKNKLFYKNAIELRDNLMGYVMTMDQATDEWKNS